MRDRALASRRLRALRPGSQAHSFPPELNVAYRPRDPRRPTLVQVSGAVIAAAGENGHLELRVGPGEPPDRITGVIATRHEAGEAPAGRVASGGQLTALVAPGHWYRITTHDVAGFQPPQYVLTTFVTETPL